MLSTFLGCTYRKVADRPISGLYHNGGGFAYRGHGILLKTDGTYSEWFHTDVIGEKQDIDTGRWVQNETTIILQSKNETTRVLHVFSNGLNIVILTEEELKIILKTNKIKIKFHPLKKEGCSE